MGDRMAQQAAPRFGGIGLVECLHTEQHGHDRAALHGGVGLRGQRLRRGQPLVLAQPATLPIGVDSERHRDDEENHQSGDEGPQPPDGATLAGPARPDVLLLGRADVGAAFGQPAFRLGKGHAAEQGSLVAAARLELLQCGTQPLLPSAEVAIRLDPAAQAVPGGNQRLMGQFHRLGAGVVAPGHHEAGGGQPLGDRPERRVELGTAGDAAGRLGAQVRPDELDEQPSRQLFDGLQLATVHVLRVACERTCHAAEFLVRRMVQRVVPPALPQHRQGELQQGQAAGLVADVGEDPLDQAGFVLHRLGQRPLDDAAQLSTGHPADHQRRVLQPLGQLGVVEGGTEEIGTQRQHDRDGGVRCQEYVQELPSRPGVLRVHLLELVDDQHQSAGTLLVQYPLDDLGEAGPGQRPLQPTDLGRPFRFGPAGFEERQQRPGQYRQRRGTTGRPHLGDRPVRRTQPGHRTGEDERGLAGTGRTDHGHQRLVLDFVDQPVGQVLPPEEQRGIPLAEGGQAAVGAEQSRRRRRAAPVLLHAVPGGSQRALLAGAGTEQADQHVEPIGRRQDVAGEVLPDDSPRPAGLRGQLAIRQRGPTTPPRLTAAQGAQQPGQIRHRGHILHPRPRHARRLSSHGCLPTSRAAR
ncbi:MAG: hypothetical protein AUI10_11530 [Actinobacteria bacterium 13_2_20CM_2_72_6]|nr:MAG: hypothetical protein AUI10_11530 [Actinobacteria bacterium 13_2_20CM_2_72_6]